MASSSAFGLFIGIGNRHRQKMCHRCITIIYLDTSSYWTPKTDPSVINAIKTKCHKFFRTVRYQGRDLEALTLDRNVWSITCKKGLASPKLSLVHGLDEKQKKQRERSYLRMLCSCMCKIDLNVAVYAVQEFLTSSMTHPKKKHLMYDKITQS